MRAAIVLALLLAALVEFLRPCLAEGYYFKLDVTTTPEPSQEEPTIEHVAPPVKTPKPKLHKNPKHQPKLHLRKAKSVHHVGHAKLFTPYIFLKTKKPVQYYLPQTVDRDFATLKRLEAGGSLVPSDKSYEELQPHVGQLNLPNPRQRTNLDYKTIDNLEVGDVIARTTGREEKLHDGQVIGFSEYGFDSDHGVPQLHVLSGSGIKPVVEHIEDDLMYDFRTKTHSYGR